MKSALSRRILEFLPAGMKINIRGSFDREKGGHGREFHHRDTEDTKGSKWIRIGVRLVVRLPNSEG